MKIRWVRGNDKIVFTKPDIWFSLGLRGSGKSSMLEHIGLQYFREGATILDLFGSRDGEGLAWLRSDIVQQGKARPLILTDENVDVKSNFDVKKAVNLSLSDLEKYDIIISTSPFYHNIDREFTCAAKITDLLYSRMHWKRIVYIICREASNFYYSRLKVSENQTFAKAQMIYLLRESRHMGLALGLDSLRFYSLDIDIRNLTDYLLLKAQGAQGLTKDLKWMYSFVEAATLRSLKPHQFVILTRNGSIGYGVFPEVPWHKKEREDILKVLDIKVEYGEMLLEGVQKGTFKTVGDKEHAEIIRLYCEESLSHSKIAEKLKRSARTVWLHIGKHNRNIKQLGYCPSCKRANSPFYNKAAVR